MSKKLTAAERKVARDIIRAAIAACAVRVLGLSVADVADAMGMSRQGTYNALARSRGHATTKP